VTKPKHKRTIRVGKRARKMAEFLEDLDATMALVKSAVGHAPRVVILGRNAALALGASRQQLDDAEHLFRGRTPHTQWVDQRWLVMRENGGVCGSHKTKSRAVAIGDRVAREEGLEHVVHDRQGYVEERRRP
jgi:hypothetical protein